MPLKLREIKLHEKYLTQVSTNVFDENFGKWKLLYPHPILSVYRKGLGYHYYLVCCSKSKTDLQQRVCISLVLLEWELVPAEREKSTGDDDLSDYL